MKQYALSLDENTVKAFDTLIGDIPRSVYIRRMLSAEVDMLKAEIASINKC